ncbi:replication initiator protein [Paraburkholderia tropica]|uniref:Initiator Replication protein n=3 Tax=Pseudomonadota TaxID=1224 RepID=A0AAQ1GCE5_9BURK|nr:replication initiator protein [Paraburkholderia tropica]PZW73601.1 replication initiator protein [Paraburkholderia tropica]QNB15313.1 replication initiation protein [Paraburkholderia tropica]RQN36393.1 RepB family plasmid replication initiator protein [Paraburkholderia tropica]SEJ16677.1 Initiator Replication protein [Paraburkholderia tropica]
MSEDIGRRTTTQQMSLGLFEEMSGQPISESTREIGFQRNNVFVAINGLGLSSRRFIDAAYFIAAQEPIAHETYDVDLNYFKWLMRYESRNVRHLQSVIKEAQRVLIEVTDTPPDRAPTEDDQWVSEQLMGSVKIGKGRIQFRIPPLMLRHITGPEKHHWLNLCITAAFSQTFARAIYDYIQPFVTAGLTDWIELDVMRRWPGKLGSSASEFKHFRPKYLDPAVKQINELSDLDISYETRADGESSRKINKIRFRLKRKDTVAAMLTRQPNAHDLLLTLKEEFGLSNKQFDVIAEHRMSWNDERIQQAIEYTRFRLNQGKVTKSPAGYLMKALSHNWQVSEAERKMVAIQTEIATAETAKEAAKEAAKAEAGAAVKQSIATRDEEARTRRNDEVQRGREHFESADDKTRKELVRLYIASQAGKLMLRRLKLEAGALSDANILNHSDLSWYFGQFVYGKLKQNAA